jgi:putative oxidoreductase
MNRSSSERMTDEVILAARILLVLLFLVFGWAKLTNYTATVGYMAQAGTPLPPVAAIVAIAVEFFCAIAVLIGVGTRPLALLMALYTLATALIGHHFWTMTGPPRMGNAINFYKNLSIIGGFLLLYVTGPGRYSLDARLAKDPGATLRSA